MFTIERKLDQSILDELTKLVKTINLKEDVSSYARGRMRTWLNVNWDLKNKTFSKSDDVYRGQYLWDAMKDIWPAAEIGLLTYSGVTSPKGISLHRDDSYADYESWGVQLTGTCEFAYMGGYRRFEWEEEPEEENKQMFTLNPGDIFRFNCKNRHSAIPSSDRYAINLWKVSKKFRSNYTDVIKPKGNPLF